MTQRKNNVEALNQLVAEASDMEELAQVAQEGSDDVAAAAIRRLRNDYQGWYARALALLPSDSRESFDAEFKGSVWSSKIKAFLESPRLPSILDTSSLTESMREHVSGWQNPWRRSFQTPLNLQRQILMNLRAESELAGSTIASLEYYAEVFGRLGYSIAEIGRVIRGERQGLIVDDEYSLQRLMHAVLVALSNEVEAEESGPSRLGSSPRIDFVVRDRGLAIEAKYMRESLSRKKLGDEIAADVLRYSGHPIAQGLLVVIYDPEKRYSNPVGLQNDLQGLDGGFPVRVVFVA